MEKIDEIPVEAPAEQKPEEKPVDPATQAAHEMPAMLAWFKNIVTDTNGKFGGVHAKAVLLALAEAPFNETEPHFTTQEQYDVYYLGQRITNAKFMILMASLRDAANKQNAEKETKEENKDGV
jgi:hypothetical protein